MLTAQQIRTLIEATAKVIAERVDGAEVIFSRDGRNFVTSISANNGFVIGYINGGDATGKPVTITAHKVAERLREQTWRELAEHAFLRQTLGPLEFCTAFAVQGKRLMRSDLPFGISNVPQQIRLSIQSLGLR